MDAEAAKQVRGKLTSSPRWLGVYKPLFGAAFQDYIGTQIKKENPKWAMCPDTHKHISIALARGFFALGMGRR